MILKSTVFLSNHSRAFVSCRKYIWRPWCGGITLNTLVLQVVQLFALSSTKTTTTKPFISGIWGRIHEPKENYAGSGTWISFLHLFLSNNMPSFRHLGSISCCITSIHIFFGLPFALLTCSKLIRSTRQTGTSVGLRRT